MQQRRQVTLLWLCLLLLLHVQLTPGSCQGFDSTGRSWEAARAAARAQHERNLHLAGLVDRTGVAAERTAHAGAPGEAAAPLMQHATQLAAGKGVNSGIISCSSRVDTRLAPTPLGALPPAGVAAAVIEPDATMSCPASMPSCHARVATWAADNARAATAAAANAARSAAATAADAARSAAAATPGVARSAAATAAEVARSAAAATPGIARSAAATAADAARSVTAATPGIARSAAAAAATTARFARSAATAAAGVARSAAAGAAAAADKAAQPAAAAAAAVEKEANPPWQVVAVTPSRAAGVASQPHKTANVQSQQQQQQQQQQQKEDWKDNQQSKQEQQQEAQLLPDAWALQGLTHLCCFLLGWLLRGKCGYQQPPATAVACDITAADDAVETCSSKLPAATVDSAVKTNTPVKADTQQQHQHALCYFAVEAPAGEQEQQQQQQQDPAPSGSAVAPAAAGDKAEDEAASSRATSLSSDDELSTTKAAGAEVHHHSAPNSRAAVSKRQLGRRAGLRHVLRLAPKPHSPASSINDQAGSAAASNLNEQQQQQQHQQQHFGLGHLHSRGDSGGGRSSAGGARRRRSSSSSRGGGVVNLMQLQGAQAPVLLVRSGGQQQQMQVTFTAGPEVVHGVLIPAVRVLQQLAVGVSGLSVLSTAVLHQLHNLSSAGSQLTSQLEQLLGWAGRQERQSRLAAQQALGERAGQLGLGLLLGGLAAAAVRVGRLWEVHQVCMARSRPSGWHRLAGMAGLSSGWQYLSCCSQQLGLYAVGLLALYYLARASWQGLLSSSSSGRRAGGAPSRAWLLDLVLFRGVVCSLIGVHVVHCLGAAWLPWLLLWLVWVGCQIAVQVVQLRLLSSMLAVACVGLLLPLAMAALPFHAQALMLQGWALEGAPWVKQLLVLQQMLPL